MVTLLSLAFSLALALTGVAHAQSANEFSQMFGDVVQQDMRQAAQVEWQRLPARETECIDARLRGDGSKLGDLINRGVTPNDVRLGRLRNECRAAAAQPAQVASQAQASPYVVDDLALGAQVHFGSESYKQYRCEPSQKFAGFTWCHKEEKKREGGNEVTVANSILHEPDGTSWYVNRSVEPAFMAQNAVAAEVARISEKFGQPPLQLQIPQRRGLPNAVIATWGNIKLESLDANEIATVAAGGNPRASILVSFLGDLKRSAQAGVPVYAITGGAGFLWAATFDRHGGGVLRFLAIDASHLSPQTVARDNTQANPTLPGAESSPSTPPQSTDTSPDFQHLLKAAEDGHAQAQFDVGLAYQDGKGVSKDYAKAVDWYRKAAAQGFAEAQNSLGAFYRNGLVVSKDLKQAIEWYQKAANQGFELAKTNLQEAEAELSAREAEEAARSKATEREKARREAKELARQANAEAESVQAKTTGERRDVILVGIASAFILLGPVAFLFWKQRALQTRNLSLKVAKSEKTEVSVAALETALGAVVRETFQAADKRSFVGANAPEAADDCSKGEAVPASVEVPNLSATPIASAGQEPPKSAAAIGASPGEETRHGQQR